MCIRQSGLKRKASTWENNEGKKEKELKQTTEERTGARERKKKRKRQRYCEKWLNKVRQLEKEDVRTTEKGATDERHFEERKKMRGRKSDKKQVTVEDKTERESDNERKKRDEVETE